MTTWCEAYVIVDGVRTECQWPKGHAGFHTNGENVEPQIEWDGDTTDGRPTGRKWEGSEWDEQS